MVVFKSVVPGKLTTLQWKAIYLNIFQEYKDTKLGKGVETEMSWG